MNYKDIMAEEGAVVKACLDYLTVIGAYVWRNNSGALRDSKNRLVRFGKVGSSDILGVLPDGRFIAVECKSKSGKLSAMQREFLFKVGEMGGVAIVARCVEDVMMGLGIKGARGKV